MLLERVNSLAAAFNIAHKRGRNDLSGQVNRTSQQSKHDDTNARIIFSSSAAETMCRSLEMFLKRRKWDREKDFSHRG